MNKEFLKMQKLAGVITESQYNKLSEEIKTTSEYTKFYNSIINAISAAKTNIKSAEESLNDDDKYEPTKPEHVELAKKSLETLESYVEYLEDLDIDTAEELERTWDNLDKEKIKSTINLINQEKINLDKHIKNADITFKF
jgi:hypothetical protein